MEHDASASRVCFVFSASALPAATSFEFLLVRVLWLEFFKSSVGFMVA